MRKKANKAYIAALAALLVAGVGVVSLVKAYVGESPKVVVEGNYIEATQPEAVLGSSVGQAVESSNFTEIGLNDPVNLKTMKLGFAYGTMPTTGTATTTQYWLNNTGQAVYVDATKAYIQFSGTPSSSVIVSMGTSTASGLALYTTTPPAGIIAATTIATSSVALTREQGLVNQLDNATAKSLIYVANNEYVLVGWRQENVGCTGVFCEAVTATPRGYDASFGIPYMYIK